MSERDRSRQQPEPGDRSHEETRRLLPEYAKMLTLKQAPETHYPLVAAHLAYCTICRAELDALLVLVKPIYAGEVELVSSVPDFDFSFLRLPIEERETTEEQQTGLLDNLKRLVVTFSDALLASLKQQALVRATRGEAIYRYKPDPQPPDNLSLTIEVFADDDMPDLGNVQVLTDVPGRDPLDQAGIGVTLRVGDRVWEGMTGESGSVTFMGVPLELLPQLHVEVTVGPTR